MRLFLFFLTALILNTTFSQEKQFFDSDWEKTTKENASFYREVKAVSDSLFSIKDYYINGNIQMEAFSSDSIKLVNEKTSIWYDTDGNKELSAEFENSKTNGKVIHYLKNGDIKYQGIFVDDAPYSGYINNNCNACIVNVSEYKKGEILSTNYFYENSKQIAVKRHYLSQKEYSFDNLRTEKEVFYDENNKIIATLSYYNDENGYAYPKEGVQILYYNNDHREVTTIESITTYDNHYKDGLFITYTKDGKELSNGTYKKGEPYSGSIFEYNSLINYIDGVSTGEQIFYDKDGKVFSKATFKDGKIYEGTEKHYKSKRYYGKGEIMKIIEYQDYDFKILKSEIFYKNGNDSQRNWYDKNGKLIAECDFIDGRPYNGIEYYSYHNKYTPYINGVIHGIEKIFDDKNKIIKETQYSVDTVVDVLSFSPNTNKKLFCVYRNNKPFNGEEFDGMLNSYKNGNIVKEKIYERNDETDKLILVNIYEYIEGTYNFSKNISFKENKRYELVYKNGYPFEGEIYHEDDKLLKYQNGEKNGAYFYYEEDSILIEKGIFKDDHKEGVISYTPVNEKPFECLYKDGKPFEGTALEYNNKNEYKNGLKNGICLSDYPYKSSQEYVNGKKEGAFAVVVNGFNFGGEYKNDKPYSGAFLNEDGSETKYMIEHYNKGKKFGLFSEYNRNYGVLTEINYEEDLIIWQKSILTGKDSIIAFADFKNGILNNGKIVSFNEEDDLLVSSYKKGQLSGVENIYIYSYEIFLKKSGFNTYKHGLKSGKYSKIYTRDYEEKTVAGTYKKGKPYSGSFVNINSEIEITSNYKRGLKHGKEIYNGDGYSSGKKNKTELTYHKGKPMNGKQLESVINYYDYYYTHHYQEGKKIKIEIPNSFTNAFFYTKGNSISYVLENLIININYSNTDKKNGTIIFTENEKKIGEFVIENNILKSGNLEINHPYEDFFLKQEVIKDKVISKIFSSDLKLYYQYNSNTIFNFDSLDHTSISMIKNGLEPQKNNPTFTIHKEEKVISELIIAGNKIKDGVFVRFPDFWNKKYTIVLVEDFKHTIEVEDVNYEDIEKEIEKLKKK